MSDLTNIEEVWSTRSEKHGAGTFVGFQNPLPQTHEDEQRLFAELKSRKGEIRNRAPDDNTYMIIHEDGGKMTVAFRVDDVREVPEGMVSLFIPEESYEVFRFEEKFICDFWRHFCEEENRAEYGLSTVKARYETFRSDLQPNGVTEIHYPKR